ncbi:MAG TPA: GH1 family beta-glucosidase [Candidatus Eisenbacteria bacterium]|nr:GH1 family beta-glucosidase [Candidatus Eisenbacteria bacterium]
MTDDPRLAAFPAGFTWGAATAAYQIEGSTTADGRGPSIWDTFCRVPGATRNGETGDIAVDHYRRYREDVTLMAGIGLQAYRFSIAWPRIQPTGRGRPLAAGLDFYSRLVDSLVEAGIEPVVALYHWDLPQALQDRGGWPTRETALRFVEYAEIVYGRLHDRVRRWGTINEPWCVAFLGHAAGLGTPGAHAPGVGDPARAIDTVHHLLLGHGLAVRAMRAIDPSRELGIYLNLAPARAVGAESTPGLLDGLRRIDALQNRLFLDPLLRGSYPADALADLRAFGRPPVEPGDLEAIAEPLDWLGVNYYFDRLLEAGDPGPPLAALFPGLAGVRQAIVEPLTDMGWPITPVGLHDLLVRLRASYPYLPPLLISENGAAYDDQPAPDGSIDDRRRIDYLAAHIAQLRLAIAEGVDTRGYFVWSLLDNFEWAEGYSKRFGLVHVDYATQRRTPRRSAGWYRDVIARNGLAGDGAASDLPTTSEP